MEGIIDLICVACRNHNCDYYTMYQGYLMCEFCLDDWLKSYENDFDSWCVQHRKELDKEEKEVTKTQKGVQKR